MNDLHSKNFIASLKENKNKIFVLFLIYQSVIVSIGILNYPYIDDSFRQLHGVTDFAWSYSRWGSELLSWGIQGSRHLTDLGLTTNILSAIFLTFASSIVVYVLTDGKLNWLPLLASSLIGLNPWFLECLSFRFDSPYMSLSILASVFPFLWWNKKKPIFFCISILGIFIMCNTYQASSGIYIIMVLTLLFKNLLHHTSILLVIKKTCLSALAFFISMIAYSGEMRLNPHLAERGGNLAIASIHTIPSTIQKNVIMLFNTIHDQSAKIWIVLGFFLLILFILSSLVKSKVPIILGIVYSIAYLFLAFIFSYGVFLIFSDPLASARPRYMHGFGTLIGIILILLCDKTPSRLLNKTSCVLTGLFVYYIISFAFTYSASLGYQKEAFERQSVILTSDIKNFVSDTRKDVFMNQLFKDSPVLQNTEVNYPILKKLIPANTDLYWPNITIFNNYSNLNLNIQYFDATHFNFADKKLELSNAYYDIYSTTNQLYIYMK